MYLSSGAWQAGDEMEMVFFAQNALSFGSSRLHVGLTTITSLREAGHLR